MPYVANKRNMAQITNIHYWDSGAATWSGNLVGVATPFALLPNPLLQTDLVVFGSDTSVVNSGPFCSLVFDIGAAIAGVTVLTWRYSDIGGNDPLLWQVMVGVVPFQDNTNASGLGTGVAFDTAGINSVHWEQPALWVPRVPIIGGVTLGVTGYWICARMDTVPGAATPPTQTNRRIYSILWPAIQVAADDVEGDLRALMRTVVRNESSGGAVFPIDPSTRIVAGLRSTSRGENFVSYLNLAQEQNPTGVTVAATGTGVIAADVQTPTGWKLDVAAPVAGWTQQGSISIDDPLSAEYAGLFHAYMRVDQIGGAAGDISARLRVALENTVWRNYIFTSRVAELASTNDWEIYDLGRVQLVPDDTPGPYNIYINIELDGDGVADIDIFDLVLIPVDEWAGEFDARIADDTSWGLRALSPLGTMLDADSITVPKWAMHPRLVSYSTGELVFRPTFYGPAPASLEPEREQQLHFFFIYDRPSSFHVRARFEVAGSVTMQKLERYASMRGAR